MNEPEARAEAARLAREDPDRERFEFLAREQPDGSWDVITDKGSLQAEHVVNCGGLWAREIGRMVGLELPVVRAAVCTGAPGAAELATAGIADWPGSHAESEVTVFDVIASTTGPVTAVQGSWLLPAGADSSPLTRCTPLPAASVTSQM